MKSRAERETLVRRAADEDRWDVFSEDPKVVRRVTSLYGPGIPVGDGFRWLLEPSAVSFRKKRVMTAESKARMAANLRAARG